MVYLPAVFEEAELTAALNAVVAQDGGGWKVVSSVWTNRIVVFLER